METIDLKKANGLIKEDLESNCYDMQDEFDNDMIQRICMRIVRQIKRSHETISGAIPFQNAGVNIGNKYLIKVHNANKDSWLSMSDTETTAVSRSLAHIINPAEEIDEYQISSLISMLNEAWFTLNYPNL